MSTVTASPSLSADPGDDIEYRSLNAGAIASLVLGVFAPLLFVAGRDSIQFALMLSPVALIGLVVGLRSLARIKANPEQYTGTKLATVGALLSGVSLVGGLAFAGYVYATEVPDGYARTSFADMRPDEVEERGNVMIPPDIEALDGKKVFIKGYIRPDSTPYRQNINKFLLVRDNQQCCFGDISTVNYFDQMAVDLQGKKTVDYSQGVFRIGGTLRVNPHNLNRGQPVFALEADYAK